MQKFEGTLITDNGLNLLTTVNGGDDKIQYTKAVLATDDLTQASETAIQKISELKIKMSSPISINRRINDTINLSASFTNETITEDFDFYCIGWYAKGVKDSTEYLIAVSPSTVKQTMPAGSNNAATAAISPKYAMTLSRSAEVVVNTKPAGSVTKEYVDNQVNALIAEGIINNGSIVSTTDDCNKMITTSYHLVKGSLPLNAPDGFSTNGQIIVYGNKDTTDGVTQLAYDDINGASYVRSYNPTNNQWSTWDLIITKSQLNAVLPTDIARTGETNEFKAKNTFDVDPVNKDGNSYGLAKDIATKVTDNGDNSIEINKQAVTPVRDNKNGSINFNSKDMTPADDSAVVHTTGDETIDGQKKFKTDPTDSAGNAYAKTVDVNQQLDKKVTDNKDGTEQLNGVQVKPFNKLSDTIGGRNMATNPGDVLVTPVDALGWSQTVIGTVTPEFFKIINQGTAQPITISLEINTPDDPTKANFFDRINLDGVAWGIDGFVGTNYFSVLGFKWLEIGNNVWKGTYSLQFDQYSNVADSNKPNINLLQTKLNTTSHNFTVLGNSLCLYWGTQAIDWTPAPEDKVNVSDMRKPASDVAGIEEVSAKQDKIGYTPADDSKVAHLSGANNFDTVPTVNNNPLLLASSLPSDLARTSQDANFTAKLQQNGQDVALANNTIARNPNTGSVSTANTFTAAQTFSIAPTITDASKDKGDNQAATMADLKSLENSAWHQLNNVPLGGTFLYRIDRSSKRIYISYSLDTGICINSGTT
ncbi:pyocin knob domain-containing protein, partial [Lentilactobacillus diolivorans]